MRAVVIARPGGPEVLEVRDMPAPEPGSGEVRVRVHAFGVNRADLLQRRGLYPAPADAPRDIPGLEFAGVVDAVGPAEPGGRGAGAPARGHGAPGAKVMGIVGGGAYAEYVTVRADQLIPIPAGLSFAEAAAVPEVFLTAFDALERLAVTAGEWVLVHAVGSGVGTAAVQLIRARDAKSIGTSRTPSKLKRAQSLGLDEAADGSADELRRVVRAATGTGVHAGLDLIGGPLFPVTLEVLREQGRLMLIGLTAGARVEVDLGVILRKRLRVEGTALRTRAPEEKAALAAAFGDAVVPLFERGVVKPVLDRAVPLEQIVGAHACMEGNENFGKIVVEIP
jgi:NADPH2:quinone reductase